MQKATAAMNTATYTYWAQMVTFIGLTVDLELLNALIIFFGQLEVWIANVDYRTHAGSPAHPRCSAACAAETKAKFQPQVAWHRLPNLGHIPKASIMVP